ncbi:putative solute carrier family 22 member 31 [Lissotriton helveticus]
MDFDTRVAPQVGGFGRYSRLLAAASWLPNVLLALACFSEVFYAAEPEHHCRPDPALLPGTLANLTGTELLNASVPRLPPPASGLSRCELYHYSKTDGTAIPSNGTRPQINGTGPCTRGWDYHSEAGLERNIVTKWDLVCDNHWKVPVEKVSFMLGYLSGFLVFGSTCDRFGRRSTFLAALLLAVLFGTGVTISMDFLMFLLTRLFQGAALAGIFLSLYVARLEVCDPTHRLMFTMVGGFFWVAGELLLPGLAVLCRDWWILQAVGTVSLGLLFVYWCCQSLFPESPRWLLATRQLDRCKKALRIFAEANGINVDDELYNHDNLFAEIDALAEDDPLPHYYTIYEIFRSRVIGKNTLILGFTALIGSGIRQCFSRNLMGYGPPLYFMYFLLAGSEALACIFLCVTVDRFGRRGILLLCAILTGISSLLLLALTQYLYEGLTLAISILGSLASHGLVMLSIFFASEILPTVVRGAGLGLIMASSFVGKAVAPLMDLQNNRGFFLHHVVFSSFAILSVLTIMLLPESKRKCLPESLKDGENLRRPPLFLSHTVDGFPLLSQRKRSREYNPENYSRLVTATKKMLGREGTGREGSQLLKEMVNEEETETLHEEA